MFKKITLITSLILGMMVSTISYAHHNTPENIVRNFVHLSVWKSDTDISARNIVFNNKTIKSISAKVILKEDYIENSLTTPSGRWDDIDSEIAFTITFTDGSIDVSVIHSDSPDFMAPYSRIFIRNSNGHPEVFGMENTRLPNNSSVVFAITNNNINIASLQLRINGHTYASIPLTKQ